jgi:hypothetical protein
MELTPKLRKQLLDALLAAFPSYDDLKLMMLSLELPEEMESSKLSAIASGNKKQTVVCFEVLEWAEDLQLTGEVPKPRWDSLGKKLGIPEQDNEIELLKAIAAKLKIAERPEEVENVERVVLKDIPFANVPQWLDKLTRLRRAICRVEPQAPPNYDGYATAFLVTPDVIMTNYHVIEPFVNRGVGKALVRFDYETDKNGVAIASGRVCTLAAEWRLLDSPTKELDFALVRLAEPAGADQMADGTRGTIQLVRHDFGAGNPMIILQHPQAQPLQMAIGSVVGMNTPNRVTYTANTLPGSSGSPCFTGVLEAVALHHASTNGALSNNGIPMRAILDYLATRPEDVRRMKLDGLLN